MADDDNDNKDLLGAFFEKRSKFGPIGKVRGWMGKRSKPIVIIIFLVLLSVFGIFPFIIGMWSAGFIDLGSWSVTVPAFILAVLLMIMGYIL